MGVQEVRWDKGGTVRSGDYNFFLRKRKQKSSIGTRFFVHHRIVSAVKRVEFVSDRVSYIVLRGCWCNIIVQNVHAKSEERSDDSKDRDIQDYNFACFLYGCETWSLTLREERRLRVFENRVLRRIFGPRTDEVTEEWRKLLNEELNDLYSSHKFVRVIKSGRMRLVGHVARMGERRSVYRVLVGKPERKKPLGRPRLRWEDNIKMDI